MTPDISVLLPVRNGAAHLAEALDSLLAQTDADFEIVAIDDGSTDATPAILAGYADKRLAVLRNEEGGGLPRALNAGLAAARGALVARHDADDICLPGRLARQAARLSETGSSVCFGRAVLFGDGPVSQWRESSWPLTLWRGLVRNAYGFHPAAMFRTETVRGLGGYSGDYPHAEDYDLWDRCAAAGVSFCYLQDDVIRYRLHPGAVSVVHKEAGLESRAAISKRALLRTFPGMTEDEARGLHWLMTGCQRPEPEAVTLALTHCVERARDFAQRMGGAPEIGSDLSVNLLRRLDALAQEDAAMAKKCMLAAAGLSCRPRDFLRAARTWLRP